MMKSLETWTKTFSGVCPTVFTSRVRAKLKTQAGIQFNEENLTELKLVRVYCWVIAWLEGKLWFDERWQKVLQSFLHSSVAFRNINSVDRQTAEYVGFDLEETEEMVLFVATNFRCDDFGINAGQQHLNLIEINSQSIFVFEKQLRGVAAPDLGQQGDGGSGDGGGGGGRKGGRGRGGGEKGGRGGGKGGRGGGREGNSKRNENGQPKIEGYLVPNGVSSCLAGGRVKTKSACDWCWAASGASVSVLTCQSCSIAACFQCLPIREHEVNRLNFEYLCEWMGFNTNCLNI